MKRTLSAAQGFRHTLGLLMVVMVVLAAGSSMAAEKIPVLNMGYIFTTHHSPEEEVVTAGEFCTHS